MLFNSEIRTYILLIIISTIIYLLLFKFNSLVLNPKGIFRLILHLIKSLKKNCLIIQLLNQEINNPKYLQRMQFFVEYVLFHEILLLI